jgi:hypothetical protein
MFSSFRSLVARRPSAVHIAFGSFFTAGWTAYETKSQGTNEFSNAMVIGTALATGGVHGWVMRW